MFAQIYMCMCIYIYVCMCVYIYVYTYLGRARGCKCSQMTLHNTSCLAVHFVSSFSTRCTLCTCFGIFVVSPSSATLGAFRGFS